MVLPFEPMHLPRQVCDGALHQDAIAERIASAVDAKHRHLDLRQMRSAQLLPLAGGMQRVGEEKEPVAFEAFGGEHGGDAPAHRASANDQLFRPQFLTYALNYGGKA